MFLKIQFSIFKVEPLAALIAVLPAIPVPSKTRLFKLTTGFPVVGISNTERLAAVLKITFSLVAAFIPLIVKFLFKEI